MIGVVGNERRRLFLSSNPEADAANAGDDEDDEDGDEYSQQELGSVFLIDVDLEDKDWKN